MAWIRLVPTGVEIQAEPGMALRDLLFEQGVEFPCGGHGRCRGCRVRVLEGDLPLNDAQRSLLTAEEIAAGWRLACQGRAEGHLAIELRQWDASILADETRFAFHPKEGLGIALDVGTTTLVAQLLDLETGHVLAVRSGLNPQARHGADVMSRVQFAVAEGGAAELTRLIRAETHKMARQLLTAAGTASRPLRDFVLAGNTVMHHLFCGVDLTPLAAYPFEPVNDGLHVLSCAELKWDLPGKPSVRFLPCLGGFVGSDILAGLIATGAGDRETLEVLIDLGTNGEIVVGNRERMLCASTAAGPAFEGARISCGMRAATGAIWRVTACNGRLHCETLGSAPARGICGSGLVDAVAAGLDTGRIRPTGRLAQGEELPLAGSVTITQTDIRQLQLAKGAIAAGIHLLLNQWGARLEDVAAVHLAGAFGNYVDRVSARRIGLLPFPLEKIAPAGNAALLGAKLALFAPENEKGDYSGLRARVRHVSLSADPAFQDRYVEEMIFPNGAS